MVTSIYPRPNSTYELGDDLDWSELYPQLLSITRRLVYKYRLPCWNGQEEDLVADVAQETAKRLIERSQKAARGEATLIDAPEHMMVTIALNYVRDLVRREHRTMRLPVEELTRASRNDEHTHRQMAEIATEGIYYGWLFLQMAHEIAHFPCKQRQAILIDLANRMHFDEQPTSLQDAFLAVGIDLQDYQQPLPDNPKERAQYASLLCLAYKRLAQFTRGQNYDEAS